MPQTIHRGIKILMDEANAQIETVSATDAIAAYHNGANSDVVIVDIRDPREIEREAGFPAPFPAPAACWNSGSTLPVPMRSRFSRATRSSSFIARAECVRRWRRKPRRIWD